MPQGRERCQSPKSLPQRPQRRKACPPGGAERPQRRERREAARRGAAALETIRDVRFSAHCASCRYAALPLPITIHCFHAIHDGDLVETTRIFEQACGGLN